VVDVAETVAAVAADLAEAAAVAAAGVAILAGKKLNVRTQQGHVRRMWPFLFSAPVSAPET
jgi:uncharacterized protein YdbL (DUF1318 family)